MSPDFQEMSRLGRCAHEFHLTDGSRLTCEEVVRVVPGKRIVVRGRWQEQAVYAKLFLGKDAQRYADRDRRGVGALQAAGIATPALLAVGAIGNGAIVLVFEAVADSVNVEQAWETMTSAERRTLAAGLVTEVARHHAAGLVQRDLYLKNFLLQAERILTLDGDGIRPLPRLLRERAAQANLALLLSKFDVEYEAAWLPELLARYAQMRGSSTAPVLSTMRRRTAAMRHDTIQRYAGHKVFRQCTDVEVRQSWRRYTAVVRDEPDENVRCALAAAEALVGGATSLLKRGNTCTVALAAIGARQVVVKRYNIKSFWHGLGRAWRRSRAAISWSNAHRLRLAGIATPAPLALVERRWGPLRREAWFVTQYVEAPDAATFFADAGRDPAQKVEAAERVARLCHKLYLLGLVHGDFKASNILLHAGQPVLIDLDAMRGYRCRQRFHRRHVRDLRRLMQNWRHDETTRRIFVAAFVRIYQNPELLRQAGMIEEN